MIELDLSVELSRLDNALDQIPDIAGRYAWISKQLINDLASTADKTQVIRAAANSLWTHACADVQRGRFDDRALYWGRLLLHKALQEGRWKNLTRIVERSSRQLEPANPNGVLSAVIAGFDPFNLDSTLTQCNPSGVFALALNGQRISGLRIRSMVFPVRYTDFDAGIVEQALTPVLRSPTTKMVVTVSMGRIGFDLERFPGKCRGLNRLDNQNAAISDGKKPFDPLLVGPNFLESTLPIHDTIQKLDIRTRRHVTDNRHVRTVEDGKVHVSSLNELKDKRALAGSGGDFLSNEISYRALNLQTALHTELPIGHIHVPRQHGYDLERLRQDYELFKSVLTTIANLVHPT